MSLPIEDYALLSDLHTAPLVSREGSIDWLCVPRFDSEAVFCSLLGGPENGYWRLGVCEAEVASRRYVGATFVLETIWKGPGGTARVTDFMPPGTDHADLIRRVECLEGSVEVENDIEFRFEYGSRTPWVRLVTHGETEALLAVAGRHAVEVHGPTLWDGQECQEANQSAGAATGRLRGLHRLDVGETACWVMTWERSYVTMPQPGDPEELLADTLDFWNTWADQVAPAPDTQPEYGQEVMRSLLVLRALTDSRTGGIVAAPTTSLPEEFGGSRNWDYRYTWLRDAAFTIEAMIAHGYPEGAEVWRDWLLRAIAGEPALLQVMYGLGGEKHLPEHELDHLAGYADSRPVRIGNAAAGQYQADVAGEVMLALAELREVRGYDTEYSWRMQRNLIEYCIENIDRPDHGIWEMRGEEQFFTHSRVMMWAAFDQGVNAVERYGLPGPVDEWRAYRDRLHAEIWERGFNRSFNSFTQYYGSNEVDASLLQLPQAGVLDYDDPAMLGTVAAIEDQLRDPDGLIRRYRTESSVDGLPGDEYAFLICSFWLVEQYAMGGRRDDAIALMDELVGCANDLGLLAEEYDTAGGRLAGNYPQAFSHLGLIRAADALNGVLRPVPGSTPVRHRDAAAG